MQTEKRKAIQAVRADWPHCCSNTQKNHWCPFWEVGREPKQLLPLSCSHAQVMVCITFPTRKLKISQQHRFMPMQTEKRKAIQAVRADWPHCCSNTQKNHWCPFSVLSILAVQALQLQDRLSENGSRKNRKKLDTMLCQRIKLM